MVKHDVRSPSIVDRAILRRRILSLKLGTSTDPKSVAADLQDRYPDYSRRPRQPFTALVSQILDSIRRDSSTASDDDSAEYAERLGSASFRRRQTDPAEQRLLIREPAYLRKHRLSTSNSTSISNDVVFDQKFEPEFEVTKTMLHGAYARQAKKPRIKGAYSPGQTCSIIEDLVTSGATILETVAPLLHEKLRVTDAVVVIDREQGVREKFASNGIKPHALMTITEMVRVLVAHGRLTKETAGVVRAFLDANHRVGMPV